MHDVLAEILVPGEIDVANAIAAEDNDEALKLRLAETRQQFAPEKLIQCGLQGFIIIKNQEAPIEPLYLRWKIAFLPIFWAIAGKDSGEIYR